MIAPQEKSSVYLLFENMFNYKLLPTFKNAIMSVNYLAPFSIHCYWQVKKLYDTTCIPKINPTFFVRQPKKRLRLLTPLNQDFKIASSLLKYFFVAKIPIKANFRVLFCLQGHFDRRKKIFNQKLHLPPHITSV